MDLCGKRLCRSSWILVAGRKLGLGLDLYSWKIIVLCDSYQQVNNKFEFRRFFGSCYRPFVFFKRLAAGK